MSEKSQERRLSIRPLSSLFTSFHDSLCFSPTEKSPKYPSDPKKSPRNFDAGAVGLGIVAAMSDAGGGAQDHIPVRFGASSPRSDPIPIVPGKAVTKFGKRVPPPAFREAAEEETELSESYTCVVLHVGSKSTRKREYFERAETMGGGGGRRGTDWGNTAVFLESPPLFMADFLNACYLCRKKLQGLDIFMYRGDKAFCSAECRCQQILIDEHKEKCGSGARKPLDCSVSPCSAPGLFTAGVAAA